MTAPDTNRKAGGWTPGPWEANTFQVRSGHDRIAHTGMGQLPPHRSHESAANARLIALAPTMADYILRRASQGDAEAQVLKGKING